MPFAGMSVFVIFMTVVLPAAAIMVALKTPMYFVIVRGFRYRVSRPLPISTGECFAITATRAAFGPLILVGLILLMRVPVVSGQLIGVLGVGAVLCGLRAAAWWAVGRSRPRLRGRALRQFVTAGVGIDVAFDLVLVLAVLAGLWVFGAALVVILIVLPYALAFGQRSDQLASFAGFNCTGCGYDLRGNQLGYCPECGLSSGIGPSSSYGNYDER